MTRDKRLGIASFLLVMFCLGSRLFAAPTGGTVTSGSATISQPNTVITTITQSSDKAIINWGAFSINANELVQFLQPSATSTTLNRVIGVDPSVILGTLKANGRLFLINPNGVLFGPGSVVNVGGLLATTLTLSDSNFLNGNYAFTQSATNPLSYVVNQGTIQASPGGSIVLLAPVAVNEGMIIAPAGRVGIGAASQAVVNYDGTGMINFVLPNPSSIPQNVTLSPQAFDAVLQNVVNQKGVAQASAVTQSNGQVVLTQGEGIAVNSGTINVHGSNSVNAGSVSVNSTQGTFLTPNSTIQANGEGIASSGGHVRIYSEGNTDFQSGALIEAKGGDTGNGGFVETSALYNLWVNGRVDTTAVNGKRGTWLLDPTNITITDTGAGTGSLDLQAPNVTGGDVGPDTVSVGTLESQTSDILLQATNSITVNNIVSNGGTIPLQNNVSIEMDTTTGNITFLNTANSIITSGVGNITMNSGNNATLGNLTATGTGAITIIAPFPGTVNFGNLTSSGGISISGGTVNPNNASVVVTDPNVFLSGGSFGTIGTPLKTATSNLTLYNGGTSYISNTGTSVALINFTSNPGISTSVTNTGSFSSLFVETTNSKVDVTTSLGDSLHFVGGAADTLTVNFLNADVTFQNDAGNIYNLGVTNNIAAKSLNINIPLGVYSIGKAAQSLLTQTSNLAINTQQSPIFVANTSSSAVISLYDSTQPIHFSNVGSISTIGITSGDVNVNVADTVGDSLTYTGGGVDTLAVNFPNSTVQFYPAGNIYNIGAGNHIVANSLVLNGGNIGTPIQPLVTQVSTLDFEPSGNIYASNTASNASLILVPQLAGQPVSFNNVGSVSSLIVGSNVGSGNVNVTSSLGDSLVFNAATNTLNSNFKNSSVYFGNTVSLNSANITTNNMPDTIVSGATNIAFDPAAGLTATAIGTDLIFNNVGGGLLLGDINLGAANNATLSASGAITNVGASAAITANTLSLTGGTIGTSSTPLTLNATLTNPLNATSTNGVVNLTNLGDLTLGTIASNGAGNSVILNAMGGSLFGTGATNVSGASVSLNASNGIGSSLQPVLTQTGNLAVTTTNANTASSFVNNMGVLNTLSVTTNNSNDTINATGEAMTFTGTTSLMNGNLVGTNFTMNNTGGNLALGTVNVGSGANATLIASGNISTSGSANNLTANTGNLTAGTWIGTSAAPLNTTLSTLNATANNGGVYLTNNQTLTLNNVQTLGGGNVGISTSFGDLYVTSLVSSGAFNLTAQGSIHDAPGYNLVGVGNSSLMAQTGFIGTLSGPLWENVSGGTLSLSMGGSLNGIALYLNGLVNGSGVYVPSQLRVLSRPNGAFGYYNGVCIFGPCATSSPQAGISRASNALSDTSFWLEDSVKVQVDTLSFQGGNASKGTGTSTSSSGNGNSSGGGGDSSQCVDALSTGGGNVSINRRLLMVRDDKNVQPCSHSSLHSGSRKH